MERVESSEHTSTTPPKEGRRDVRFNSTHTTVQAHLDGREPVTALVVEVSKSGLQLIVEEPLPVGVPVRIEMRGLIVEGDIRHCRPQPDNTSYAVGVLMRDVTEQS